MGDDARIDEELLFIRAVEDIDEMHIRLLARMATSPAGPEGWMAYTLVAADPGLADSIRALLGTLELHGLIAARVPSGRVQGPQGTRYDFTESGQGFLDRLSTTGLKRSGLTARLGGRSSAPARAPAPP